MARVFISYASSNRPLAKAWLRWLSEAGHEVFLDQDPGTGITVGEDWKRRLLERLRWADAVLCVVTSAYRESVWCSAEVGIAWSRGSRLLPVLAESGVVHELLGSSHYADQVADPAAARVAVDAALRRLDAAGGLGWPDGRSPFPGLRPFEADLHRVFFGREVETEEVISLLRSPAESGGRVVLVVGASGSGKSSLLRAGVRPALAAEAGWWTLAPLLPGADPVTALARELSVAGRELGLGWTAGKVRARLEVDGLGTLADELLEACPGPQVRRCLLVVIDEFGELVRVAPADERRRFVELLRPALGGAIRVVGALRTEFLDQMLNAPELAVLPRRIIDLRPMQPEALAAAVEGPARLAGISLADGLVTRMVADTGTGEALPLLAYVLAELADGVGHGGQLSVTRYEQLGEVRGALVKQADAALADAVASGGRNEHEVIAGLLRLVTVDDQDRPSRRRVVLDELPEPARVELDAFVARRLLSTDVDNGAVVVGVAHERFLSEWPPLAGAIAAQASALRARQAVEQAAQTWNVAGQPPRLLWERGQLAAAVDALAAAVDDTGVRVRRAGLRPRRRADLGADRTRRPLRWRPGGRGRPETGTVGIQPQAREFLLASIRRDRRRRRRAMTVLSTLLVVLMFATGYARLQQQAAVRQRDITVSRQVASEADNLRQTDPSLAMQLALAAYRITPTEQSRSSLLSSFATPPVTRFHVHNARIESLALSPDGRTVATGSLDATVRLSVLDSPGPALHAILKGHRDDVRSVRFSPNGRILASGSYDHTVRLWNLADPQPRAQVLREHTSVVLAVAFSPNGRLLATGGEDMKVRLWDLADPRHPLQVLRGHTGGVRAIAFSPDSHLLVTGSKDGTVRLWDLLATRRAAAPVVLPGHVGGVNSVVFSPGGRLLASGGVDRTVRLWDIGQPGHPTHLASLTGHGNEVYSVTFSPDGRMLASGSEDRTVRLWDVATRRGVASYDQPAAVKAVAFGPAGHTLVAGGADGFVRRWDVTPLPHVDANATMALSADGRVLVTGTDRALQTWNITDFQHPTGVGNPTGRVTAAAFAPTGRLLATAGADDAVRLWDLADPRRPAPIGGPLIGHINTVHALAFSMDGRLLVSGSRDVTVRLWDVTDRRRVTGTVLGSYTSFVRSLAFSPAGNTLALGTADGVRLWNINDVQHAADAGLFGPETQYTHSIAFSPDGRVLAVGSGDAVQLWDILAAHSAETVDPLSVAHTGSAVTSIAVSRDGRLLAAGNDDRTIRLWDITDQRRPVELAVLTGHTGTVRSLSFTFAGILVSADDNGTVRLWDTDTERAAHRACALAGSPITPTEWRQHILEVPYDPPCG
jgi:WD40 repeat protein